MSDEKLLEVVDLQAGYNGMAVVHDVSFSVREGEILAILGSNGSGKTTTLRAITGTIKPMSGIIRYKGEDITGMPPFKLVSKGIAMVPEGRMLFGGMTVEDNLLMGAYLNQDKKAIQERLKLVYELFKFVKEIAAIGITVIIVEQNAVDTLALCDYAFVIQNGESVIEGRGEDLLSNEDVKRAYLGG